MLREYAMAFCIDDFTMMQKNHLQRNMTCAVYGAMFSILRRGKNANILQVMLNLIYAVM